MAYGSAVGVLAFDYEVPKPHDLAGDDKRPGSESRVDGHQSRPGHQGRSQSQRAVYQCPGRGESDDDDDLEGCQDRLLGLARSMSC